ncbi:hypothetical protein ACFQZ2_22715, partial [Streptomonospora algeriensis]
VRIDPGQRPGAAPAPQPPTDAGSPVGDEPSTMRIDPGHQPGTAAAEDDEPTGDLAGGGSTMRIDPATASGQPGGADPDPDGPTSDLSGRSFEGTARLDPEATAVAGAGGRSPQGEPADGPPDAPAAGSTMRIDPFQDNDEPTDDLADSRPSSPQSGGAPSTAVFDPNDPGFTMGAGAGAAGAAGAADANPDGDKEKRFDLGKLLGDFKEGWSEISEERRQRKEEEERKRAEEEARRAAEARQQAQQSPQSAGGAAPD